MGRVIKHVDKSREDIEVTPHVRDPTRVAKLNTNSSNTSIDLTRRYRDQTMEDDLFYQIKFLGRDHT